MSFSLGEVHFGAPCLLSLEKICFYLEKKNMLYYNIVPLFGCKKHTEKKQLNESKKIYILEE